MANDAVEEVSFTRIRSVDPPPGRGLAINMGANRVPCQQVTDQVAIYLRDQITQPGRFRPRDWGP